MFKPRPHTIDIMIPTTSPHKSAFGEKAPYPGGVAGISSNGPGTRKARTTLLHLDSGLARLGAPITKKRVLIPPL